MQRGEAEAALLPRQCALSVGGLWARQSQQCLEEIGTVQGDRDEAHEPTSKTSVESCSGRHGERHEQLGHREADGARENSRCAIKGLAELPQEGVNGRRGAQDGPQQDEPQLVGAEHNRPKAPVSRWRVLHSFVGAIRRKNMHPAELPPQTCSFFGSKLACEFAPRDTGADR
jgi:hypothetical protein